MNLYEIISDVFDHTRGMWRFRWTAVAATWAVALTGWLFVYSLSDVYEASAKVSVDANSLLGNATSGLAANENFLMAVDLARRELLTRRNLEEVARTTGLLSQSHSVREIENVVDNLGKRLTARASSGNTLTITFEHEDRSKASGVVSAILDSFVEDSLGAQGDTVLVTEQALSAELQDHEERLRAAEEELAAFKKKNLGFMPDDSGDYYTRLQAALALVRENEQQLFLLEERRDELRRQIGGDADSAGQENSIIAFASCSQSAQIEQHSSQLSQLLVDYTEKHPRVITIKESIENLTEQCEAEMDGIQNAGIAPITLDREKSGLNPVYENLRIQLSNTEVDIAGLRVSLKSSRRDVTQLREDVDKIAIVEVDLKRLNRDYGVIQTRHQELLKRWEILQSRMRLDPVTKEIKFNVIEPPYAALEPKGPDRLLLLIGMTIVAVGIGVAVAFALNQLHPTFYTRRAVGRVSGVTVLGAVSMVDSLGQKRLRRVENFAWGFSNALLVVAMVAAIVFSVQGSALLRSLIGTDVT